MRIDIYSDNICPWCFIGKRHLDMAARNLGLTNLDTRWHAYQLYPQIPMDGVPRKEFMRARFGAGGGDAFKRIAAVGVEAGIAFAFERNETIPNTLNSHRLVAYAASEGKQHQTIEALMSAGFERGQDIGSPQVLLDVAAAADLDVTAVEQMLASGAYTDEVRTSVDECAAAGIQGVPLFRLENGEVIQGAQPVPVFQMLLQSAREDIAAGLV
ncbi:DsbA family oxidoreductase [Candidatus Litorirhabdus singularis]|nr:DsbA family oxidoreductase [Candidatus Litorirhabdus singularis]